MTQQNAPQLQDGAEYIGKPVNPEYGKVPGSGKMEIRLFMEILDGPLAGRRVKYVANTKDPKNTAYAKRDLKAAGWQGADIRTFVPDVTKMSESIDEARKDPKNNAGIQFSVRLARNTKDDGSVSEWWTVNTIGQGAIPLAATGAEDDQMVNGWFTEAELPAQQQGQGTQTTPPPAQRGNGNSGPPNAPGNGRIPF